MTDADPEEIVTAERDDVTVEKSFEPDDFPVPAIAFTIRSDRDTVVSVRLVDTVPDDVAPENIGFHPKYGAEFWDVEDGRIVFERDLAPGEEYTTVYGLRGGDADTAAKFMSEPALESVEPRSETGDDADVDAALDAAEIGDVTPPEGDTAELAVSGETTGSDGSTNGSAEEPDVIGIGDAGMTAGGDDLSAVDEQPSESRPEPPDAGATSAPDGSGHGSLVSELAAEIREGDVDDDDLIELRDALGVDLASASVEARIEHLQSSVSDLEAYTEAMEEFLDEEGDAQTLIAEARDGYEETADRLDDLEAQLDGVRSDLDQRLDAIDERIEGTIDAELAAIRSDFEALEAQLDAEGDARADLEADVEDLSTELEAVAEMRDRLANALSGLGATSSDAAVTDNSDTERNESDGPADADAAEADSVTEDADAAADDESVDES